MLSCNLLDFVLSKHCEDLAPRSLEDSEWSLGLDVLIGGEGSP